MLLNPVHSIASLFKGVSTGEVIAIILILDYQWY